MKWQRLSEQSGVYIHTIPLCTRVDSSEQSVTKTSRYPRPAEVPEPPLSGATVEPLSFRKDGNHTATKKKSKKPREAEKSHCCL